MRWLRLMLAALVANGFALVGAKVLAESGLSGHYSNQYVFGWYASGLLAAVVFSLKQLSAPWKKEVAIGAGMACMSFLGQICLIGALDAGTPGYLVYPIVTGANVLFVAIFGVILFRERLGWYGTAGIACGMAAVVLLSLP